MSKFKGIITAIVTPFLENGSIFDGGIENQIKYLKKHDIDNVFACGSYGAFPVMNTWERKYVASKTAEFCRNYGMKCIIHIGSTSTKEAIELAKHAQGVGADAISSVVPFYYSGTFYDEDTYLMYFDKLIKSVDIDVHCYNNPGTTGVNISPKLLGKLIGIGLKGMKDGGSDMGKMLEMLSVIGPREFDYYPSSTSSLITGFLLGVNSCISGVSLACPSEIMLIYDDMMLGNVYDATETWKKVMKARSILGKYGSRAIAVYNVLEWRGVVVGTCRSPWLPLTPSQKNDVINGLIETGIYETISG